MRVALSGVVLALAAGWVAWGTRDAPSRAQPPREASVADVPRSPANPPGSERIAGLVVDTKGNRVAALQVTAAGAAATTGADGRFALDGLAKGVYELRVEGTGIVPAEVKRVTAPGPEIQVVVTRQVAIVGRVLDEGAPAGSATVSVATTPGEAPREVVTAADGRFALTGLPEGIYALSARRGTRAALVPAVERFGAGPWEDLVVSLAPAAYVEGAVVDRETGAPVAGARVRLVPEVEQVEAAPREATSDAKGAFVLEGVAAGAWTLEVRADEFLSPPSRGVTAEEGQHLRIDVALDRGGIVTGRVVDLGGVPLQGARVEVAGESNKKKVVLTGVVRAAGQLRPSGELGVLLGPIPFPPPRGATPALAPAAADAASATGAGTYVTDRDGVFRVAGLPPGKFVVRAEHNDHAAGESASFQIEGHETVADVVLRLRRGAVVEGSVRDDRGGPILGAELQARVGGRTVAVTMTDPDGRYRLQRLPEEVTLFVSALGFAATRRAAHVAEGGSSVEDFQLVRAGESLQGRITDRARRPLSGVTVIVEGKRTTTGEDGRFAVTGLAPGAYRLEAKHPDYPTLIAEAVRAGDPVELSFAPGGGVGGEVLDTQSRGPVLAFTVKARGPDGQAITQRFERGTFEIGALTPGHWDLTIEARGFATRRVSVDVPAGREARDITRRDLRIELTQGATVAGRVFDTHGDLVAGAEVSCGDARATTDVNGRFRLTGVAPGDVPVRVRHPQAGEGEKVVPLRAGDELLSLEIRIEPPR